MRQLSAFSIVWCALVFSLIILPSAASAQADWRSPSSTDGATSSVQFGPDCQYPGSNIGDYIISMRDSEGGVYYLTRQQHSVLMNSPDLRLSELCKVAPGPAFQTAVRPGFGVPVGSNATAPFSSTATIQSTEVGADNNRCGQGDANACFEMGENLKKATAGPFAFQYQDIVFASFKKACEGGHGRGCFELGVAYNNGAGTAENQTLALSSFETGCTIGDGAACDAVGRRYEFGSSVVIDLPKARAAYRKACQNGFNLSCGMYGALAETGRGGPIDLASAKWAYGVGCKDWPRDCEKLKALNTPKPVAAAPAPRPASPAPAPKPAAPAVSLRSSDPDLNTRLTGKDSDLCKDNEPQTCAAVAVGMIAAANRETTAAGKARWIEPIMHATARASAGGQVKDLSDGEFALMTTAVVLMAATKAGDREEIEKLAVRYQTLEKCVEPPSAWTHNLVFAACIHSTFVWTFSPDIKSTSSQDAELFRSSLVMLSCDMLPANVQRYCDGE
jgi:hypothetical protein